MSFVKKIKIKDVILLVSVPFISILMFLLPNYIRKNLIFIYADPKLIQTFTTHYIHLSLRHLAGNLIWYGVLATLVYFLCSLIGERERFRKMFLSIVLLLSFLISLSMLLIVNLADLPINSSHGFSGLAAAFLGFLPWCSFTLIKRKFNKKVDVSKFMLSFLFLFLAAEAVIYLNFSPQIFSLISIFGFIGFAFFVVQGYRKLEIENIWKNLERNLKEKPQTSYWVVISIFIYLITLFAIFPKGLIVGGRLADILSHSLGFLGGFFISFLFFTKSKHSFS